MEFALFGPLDVRAGSDDRLDLHGGKRRGLLALLLVQRGRPMSLDRIVDALWSGSPSNGATGTVQTYVSQLRRLFESDATVRLERRGGGYVLDVAAHAVDIVRFERLLDTAYAADTRRDQVTLLGSALALWTGTPLEEFDGDWATLERARLERLRTEARLRRVDAQLEIGDDRVVLPELEVLVAEHPLDEAIWARLIVTQYRCGRQGDALRACRDVRQLLVEQLGVHPGTELAELERRILDHDDSLRWPLDKTPEPAIVETFAPPAGVMTFMLTDIEGSTALWDTYPETMADVLPRQEQLIANAVIECGGSLVKGRGEGDSTLSIFARASDAAAAALRIQRDLDSERWPDGIAFPTRIALHSGEAQLRNGDYYGGTLNRAARIRGVASGGQVVCSRATADLIADSLASGFVLEELGAHQLRGLRRSEIVYEIHAADDPRFAETHAPLAARGLDELYPPIGSGAQPSQATSARDALVFVGRTVELGALRRHWANARKGRAATVLLQGPLGIGKTRLLEELARLVGREPEPARVVWGRSYEHARLPYLALRDALLPLLVNRDTEHSTVLARSFDRGAGEGGEQVDAGDRGRLLLAFAQAVVDLAREHPLLLIVDDLQWADQATLDVVRHITWLVQREPAPLLVVAACRIPLESGELAAALALLAREPRCNVAQVSPLAVHEVGGLAAQLGFTTSRGTIQRLRQITNGNPLLVQQLADELNSVGASGLADDVIEHFAATSAADTTAARLRALSDETRETLTLAALLQPSATRDMLDRAAPRLANGAALAEGVRIGVIEVRGARVQFTHPVYPRVLVGELSPIERRSVHRRLAETLTADPAQRASAIEIASHFIRAGDLASPRDVLQAARLGGDEAFASCAWREAAECYEAAERALARMDDRRLDVAAELHFRAALCRMWNLDDERALLSFDAAIELFEVLGDHRSLVRARLERTRVELTNATPFAQVDAHPLEKAIAELGDDDPLRAQALADLAMAHAISGRIVDARAAAEAALLMADTRVPRATARAHLALSVTAWADLALQDAVDHLDRAIADADAAGDAYSHLAAAVRRSLTLLWLGSVQEADEAAASAVAVGEQHNLVFGMVYALAARVGAACLSGRADEAAAFADEVVLRQRLGDYSWALAFSQPTFAALRALTSGQDGAAAVLARWAQLRDEDPDAYPWGAYTDIFDVAVRLLADPAARTQPISVPGWLATTELSGALGWSGIAAAVAEIAWWKQDPELAQKARRALQWCDASDMRVVDGWLASVPRALGIATAAIGDIAGGLELIARAREWAAQTHSDLEYSLSGWWECEISRFGGIDASTDAVAAAAGCRMS